MTPANSGYQFLDHTGDLALMVRAPTLRELYGASAAALFDVILDIRTVEPRHEVPVHVHDAADEEDLLVRFLSELLFLHDARGWVFHACRVDELESDRFEGVALGEMFDPERHTILRQVKAVTYHHLLLHQDREGWSARLVLDL